MLVLGKYQRKWLSVFLSFLLAITTWLTPGLIPRTQAAIADHVVISEIYGGGGNSNATYTQDYVVLYNPTDEVVQLDGWSIQYASASGTFNNRAALSGSIQPHGYYLIVLARGGNNGVDIPLDADATGSINMSASSGKVALARTTSAISGKNDPNVVDYVGFGDANDYLGSSPAPRPTNNASSLMRKANDGSNPGPGKGNGWNTGDNGNDFVVMSPPQPKNSQSPTEPYEPDDPGDPTDPGDPGVDITPIIELRETDANGRPVKLGQTFTIEGVVTIDNGILGTQNSNFYMQDETAGINIFGGVNHGLSIKKGDYIRVTGNLDFYNGLTELIPSSITKLGTADLPDPISTTITDLNDFTKAEPIEGSLAVLTGKITNIPSADSGGNYNVTIVDEWNNALTLRVVARSGIDVSNDLKVNQTYQFTGIVGQFKTSAPYTSGYQLFPRGIEDIEEIVPFTFIHEPIREAYVDTDIEFRVISEGADSVTLFYKAVQASEYMALPFNYLGDHQYSVVLAAEQVPSDAFHYYIEARSGSEMKSSGTADAPHLVTLIVDLEGPRFYGESPAHGSKIERTRPIISVRMEDPSGIDLTTVRMSVDGTDVTQQANIFAHEISFTPSNDLAVGIHEVQVEASDLKGNVSTYSWIFEVLERFTGGNHYRGTTHNHTMISSDAAGDPETALLQAKRYHYDWFAFSDHSHSIDDELIGRDSVDHNGMPERTGGSEWELTKRLAEQYTVDGEFVVFPAFEMTATTWGHANVFGTENFVDRRQDNGIYQDLNQFYAWVLTYDDIVAQFNHPTLGNNAFNNFRPYDKEVDQLFTMFEVGNGSGQYSYVNAEQKYFEALDLGWHLAPTFGEDNHDATWGQTNRRTVIVATDLSRESLFHSMRNLRVYMTEDPNFTLDVLANGYYMGSTVDSQTLNFTISGYDLVEESPTHPDYHYLPVNYVADDRIEKVELITNGGIVVDSIRPMTTDFTWNPTYTVTGGQQWFVVRVTQMDGDRIYSAPIWSQEVTEDVKITSIEIEGDVIVAGNPALLTAVLTNFGSEAVDNIHVRFYIDEIDDEHLIGASTIASIAAKEVKSVSTTWASPISGRHTIIVVASFPDYPHLDDIQLIKDVTIREPLGITIMIDASHGNENTTTDPGTYKDRLQDFTRRLQNEGYTVVENKASLTSTLLQDVDILMLTHPRTAYSMEEMDAIRDFVVSGGSLLLTSKSNYNANPTIPNAILEHIGTEIRINDDGVFDDSPTGNFWSDPLQAKHAVRLHPHLVPHNLTDRVPTLDYYSGASLERAGHQPLLETGNIIIVARGNETSYQNNIRSGGYIYDNVSDDTGGSAIPVIATDIVGNGRIFVAGMNVFNDLQMDQSYEPKGNVQFSLNVVHWLAHRDTQVLPIATARSLTDGESVVVEGTVTSAAGVFFDAFYMQDDTGGIMVFNEVPEDSLQLGDRVRVYGTMQTFENNREVIFDRFDLDVIKLGSGDPIEPIEITTYEATLEEYQGMLVKVTGKVTNRYDENSYIIDDGSGEILIFTDGYIVNQSGPVPELEIGEILEAVGLAGKYAGGNRIRVRDTKELRKVEGEIEDRTHLYIRPQEHTIQPNEAFAIDIDFSPSQDVYAAQFSLIFDAKLNLHNIEVGEELRYTQSSQNPNVEILLNHQVVDLEDGRQRADVLITLVGVDSGYSGSGTLASLTLSTSYIGEYEFTLSDVRLLNSEGDDLVIGNLHSAKVTVEEQMILFEISGRILAEAFLDAEGIAKVDYQDVWYEDEAEVHRVIVRAIDELGKVYEGIVESNGQYRIVVPEGEYTIEVLVPGHLTYRTTVSINANMTLNMTMLAGDLNGDGSIDLRDLLIAARSFGYSSPWTQARHSIADINRDGVVDLLDISYILKNFYPLP